MHFGPSFAFPKRLRTGYNARNRVVAVRFDAGRCVDEGTYGAVGRSAWVSQSVVFGAGADRFVAVRCSLPRFFGRRTRQHRGADCAAVGEWEGNKVALRWEG